MLQHWPSQQSDEDARAYSPCSFFIFEHSRASKPLHGKAVLSVRHALRVQSRLRKKPPSLQSGGRGRHCHVDVLELIVASCQVFIDMEPREPAGMQCRMQASCYNKCIASVKDWMPAVYNLQAGKLLEAAEEEKLSVGEMSCVDRHRLSG